MIKLMSWLTGFGLSERWAKLILIVSAAAAISVGCVGLKVWYDHRIISKHDIETNIKVLEQQAPANDKASEDRASDTIRLREKAQERTDAIAKESDQPPTDADLALNCHRLREAGYDTSRFPACSGR